MYGKNYTRKKIVLNSFYFACFTIASALNETTSRHACAGDITRDLRAGIFYGGVANFLDEIVARRARFHKPCRL